MDAPRTAIRDQPYPYDTGDYRMHCGSLSIGSLPFSLVPSPASSQDHTYRGGRLRMRFAGLNSPSTVHSTTPSSSATPVDEPLTVELPPANGTDHDNDRPDLPTSYLLDSLTSLHSSTCLSSEATAAAAAQLEPELRFASGCSSQLDLSHALSSPHLSYSQDHEASIQITALKDDPPGQQRLRALAHSCISSTSFGLTQSLSMDSPGASRSHAGGIFSTHITSISYDDPAGPSRRTTLDGRLDLWNLDSPSGCSNKALGCSILELAEEAVLLRQEDSSTRVSMQSLGWRTAAGRA